MYSNSMTSSQDHNLSANTKAHRKYLRSKLKINNLSCFEPQSSKILDQNDSRDELFQDSMNMTKQQLTITEKGK